MSSVDIPPKPYSLIESMRDIGYSLETAIADIIDNSITANSKNIHVRFSWNNAKPWLAIIDDGYGMDYNKLINAMRFVSQNPLQQRDSKDLGRFGLGMKTASISQCRSLTVFSKRNNTSNCAQWDLDYLANLNTNKWSLITELPDSTSVLFKLAETYLEKLDSGTIVFWNKLDRLGGEDGKISKESQFNEAVFNVRKHLELVFHRYLSPKTGQRRLNIYFNENALQAFDPFNTSKSAELREEEFLYENERILVQPYILPHHNKLSKSEWRMYAGERGYLHEQGFYVYRNRRLIINGTWFRLIPKKELTKLLRVRVDIPNTLDHLWKIDIKKSHAFPPPGIRDGLKRIISKIEFAGKRVYKQRGQKLTSEIRTPAWKRVARENQIFYEVNYDHPLILKFQKENEEGINNMLFSILNMLESSFPRDAYFSDIASTPESLDNVTLTTEKIEQLLKYFIDDSKEAPDKNYLAKLLQTDPFSDNKELTKSIFNKRGYDY